MFTKSFEQLILEDIQKLVYERKEREGQHLDYKEALEINDAGKRELAKDASAFANSDGGYLIIGVKEEDGLPVDILGIEAQIGNQKIDEWIDNVLVSNIDNRIIYKMKLFEIDNGKVIIVIYIPLSSRRPHMVTVKHNYFKRHNTIISEATNSEVKEMFESSQKNYDNLKQFLRDRKIDDERREDFGRNEDSEKLTLNYRITNSTKKPLVIFSLIPRFLEERIDVASLEFSKWCEENKHCTELGTNVDILDYQNKIDLDSITFYKDIPNTDEIYRYLKIYRNGYIEAGLSAEIIWEGKIDNQEHLFLQLTYAVGYFWLLLNFAKKIYEKNGYFDEIITQVSLVDIKDMTLHGFGRKDANHKWAEPGSIFYSIDGITIALRNNVKITSSLIISELNEDKIREQVKKFAERLSNAFGERRTKCFDENDNFNQEGFVYFRR